MKDLIKLVISIAFVIYGLYFIDKGARSEGLIGVIGSIAAFLIIGAGVYSLLWNNNKSNKK